MNQTLRRLPVLVALLLVAASLACNANDLVGPASTVTPLSPPETLIPPTEPPPPTAALPTLAPSDTPVPTAAVTATPSEVTVTAVGADVACRFGPASEYSIEGKLAGGVTTLTLARNSSSTWIRIEHQSHPGRNCWLKATDVGVSGNLASVPVEAAPVAIVTGVHVDLSPSEVTVPGCVFPYTLSVEYSITVTGPTTVKYQLSRDNGDKVSGTQTFTASGTYPFSDHYKLGSAGDHWFQVEVTSPNAITGRGTAKASCP